MLHDILPTGRSYADHRRWTHAVRNRFATVQRVRALRTELARDPRDLAARGRDPSDLMAELAHLRAMRRGSF